MNRTTRNVLAIVLTGVWINASEFFRNELLLKGYWTSHYQAMGLTFPSAPINGAMWVTWGFVLAAVVFWISRKFSWVETALICWCSAFVLMWLAIWNLSVMPSGLLLYALPLSLLEAALAAAICVRMAPAR
jgi:Na+-transporting NADH:ubiquinone oxidoreductase subunit NqrE